MLEVDGTGIYALTHLVSRLFRVSINGICQLNRVIDDAMILHAEMPGDVLSQNKS